MTFFHGCGQARSSGERRQLALVLCFQTYSHLDVCMTPSVWIVRLLPDGQGFRSVEKGAGEVAWELRLPSVTLQSWCWHEEGTAGPG